MSDRHIFYDVSKLTLSEKATLLCEAAANCVEWHADTLDCEVSFHRVHQDVSFKEIIDRLTDSCHTVVIHRTFPMSYGEVGFSTVGERPEWFLFITLDTDDLLRLVNYFKLEERL